jgi:ankyrin repeat protein
MACVASSWPSSREPVGDATSALTLLNAAVVDGDEVRVQHLLNRTTLPFLSLFHCSSFCTLRLSEGCDINERDEMGLWPLLAAVKTRNAAIVQLLIDHGARPMKSRKRSELHALADTQKGPFPPVRKPSPPRPAETPSSVLPSHPRSAAARDGERQVGEFDSGLAGTAALHQAVAASIDCRRQSFSVLPSSFPSRFLCV